MVQDEPTYQDVMDAIAMLDEPWELRLWGNVRRDDGIHGYTCPLVALTGERGSNGFAARDALGLSRELASRVMLAADENTDEWPDLDALWVACGLDQSGAAR